MPGAGELVADVAGALPGLLAAVPGICASAVAHTQKTANQRGINRGGYFANATAVPQLLSLETTALEWHFLKKMPPRMVPERARVLWNRSGKMAIIRFISLEQKC